MTIFYQNHMKRHRIGLSHSKNYWIKFGLLFSFDKLFQFLWMRVNICPKTWRFAQYFWSQANDSRIPFQWRRTENSSPVEILLDLCLKHASIAPGESLHWPPLIDNIWKAVCTSKHSTFRSFQSLEINVQLCNFHLILSAIYAPCPKTGVPLVPSFPTHLVLATRKLPQLLFKLPQGSSS